MAEGGDSKGLASSTLNQNSARHKDSYFPVSGASKTALRENDAEFKKVKADFSRVAGQNRRKSEISRSESSRSPCPIRRRSSRRSRNSPKFKLAPFYSNDVELWFNQIETQFDLHDITDDDKRYRLTCAALSGEVASDVRDILLQPFLSHKYISLKGVLIERRGLTTPESVNKVISGEKLGSDIPSGRLRYGWFRNDSSRLQGRYTPGLYRTNACIHSSTPSNDHLIVYLWRV